MKIEEMVGKWDRKGNVGWSVSPFCSLWQPRSELSLSTPSWLTLGQILLWTQAPPSGSFLPESKGRCDMFSMLQEDKSAVLDRFSVVPLWSPWITPHSKSTLSSQRLQEHTLLESIIWISVSFVFSGAWPKRIIKELPMKETKTLVMSNALTTTRQSHYSYIKL